MLKPNGLLICEFGANDNIATVFLKKNSFITDNIYDYNRPTPLKDHEKGLANWMKQFFASDLKLMSEKMQDEIIKKSKI